LSYIEEANSVGPSKQFYTPDIIRKQRYFTSVEFIPLLPSIPTSFSEWNTKERPEADLERKRLQHRTREFAISGNWYQALIQFGSIFMILNEAQKLLRK
jgi:hypothetical protein